MRKTFHQIANDLINAGQSEMLDCRAILGWFGSGSLYFPTALELERAQKALVWLYKNVPQNGNAALDPAMQSECAAAFAQEFSLSNREADRLLTGFLDRLNASGPIIIGVEGLDGSGKTVQTVKLKEYLERQGKKVCLIDFPQYSSFFGKEIGALLSGTHDTSAMDLDEKSMCLWYALDRWAAIRNAQIEQYDYVIFNRYTLSSAVYQTARKYHALNREFADWIFGLEHIQLMLPIPDVYIFLDTNMDACRENVLKKGEREYVDGPDVYEKSQNLLKYCYHIYKELSEEVPEIKFLKCTDDCGNLKSMDEIHRDIISSLYGYGLCI